MFFIFCNTIAVNMNLGDQANLAALLRSLWRGKERKNENLLPVPGWQRFCSFSRGQRLKPVLSWLFRFLAAAALRCVQSPQSLLIISHFSKSGLVSSSCWSSASFQEIISPDAALCDRGRHCHRVLLTYWNQQHFSTGTQTQPRWQSTANQWDQFA